MTHRRHRTLRTPKHLAEAIDELTARCKHMARIHAERGVPPLRDFTPDFAGLAKIIVGQQLSTASAAAIWMRLSNALPRVDAAAIQATSDATLASLGMSRGKIRTLRALSDAEIGGALNFGALNALDDEVIIEQLTRIHGIGPWTADIYLLFALRRADAFAAADLALQVATQRRLRLHERPTAAELKMIAERWRPWRGAAARLLWSDYSAAATDHRNGHRRTATAPRRKPRK